MLAAPVPSSTPCVVPTPSSVTVAWPSANLRLSPSSVANFTHFNSDGHGRLFVLVRFDGTIKALIPPTHDIDADLATALTDYAAKITITPTVACEQYAAVFAMQFDVPSGAVHHVQVPAPAATP